MVELKAISKQAIPSALAKAQRYRLLNDPQNADCGPYLVPPG